jgi:hypothetical protein
MKNVMPGPVKPILVLAHCSSSAPPFLAPPRRPAARRLGAADAGGWEPLYSASSRLASRWVLSSTYYDSAIGAESWDWLVVSGTVGGGAGSVGHRPRAPRSRRRPWVRHRCRCWIHVYSPLTPSSTHFLQLLVLVSHSLSVYPWVLLVYFWKLTCIFSGIFRSGS